MTENLLDDSEDLPAIDPEKNYLEELVGDGKKFKSSEELAKGKFASDLYIKDLEKGRDVLKTDYLELKAKYDSMASMSELVDQLKAHHQLASSTPNLKANEVKPVDPKQIESLVSSKILEYENTKKESDNFNSVKNKLIQRYGRNYQEVVKQQIDELGINEVELNELAKKQPKVAIRTLGLDQEPLKENFQTPPQSIKRSDSFAPSAGTKRTWAYYEKMRKDQPTVYWTNKIQTQMHRDHAELGKTFEDGDWHALR